MHIGEVTSNRQPAIDPYGAAGAGAWRVNGPVESLAGESADSAATNEERRPDCQKGSTCKSMWCKGKADFDDLWQCYGDFM